jgi:hypothetical protein
MTMKHSSIRWAAFGFAAAALFLTARTGRAAEDPIAVARDLYSAAAYEEALVVLDRMVPSGQAQERISIDQYRAFCLLALGRTSEAERAIEAVLSAEPLYRPSETEASPRVRSAFASVRLRMLPIVVQQKYADAKAAYDQQNFGAAAAGFDQVLEGLADAALASAGQVPPLSDLRTLATGFRELALRAAAPPPAPPAPVAPTVVDVPTATPIVGRIYGGDEGNVVAPSVVRQDMPRLPSNGGMLIGRKGVLEVVIDESGAVEMATMRTHIDPRYDTQVVSATKNWKYKPALVNGQPVKFRKVLVIEVKM